MRATSPVGAGLIACAAVHLGVGSQVACAAASAAFTALLARCLGWGSLVVGAGLAGLAAGVAAWCVPTILVPAWPELASIARAPALAGAIACAATALSALDLRAHSRAAKSIASSGS